MPNLRTLDGLDVSGKRVLVRVDFNVPMQNGRVTSDTRIRQAAPTLQELADKGAAVIVASHMGRPKGQIVPDLSLEPVADCLRTVMPSADISFVADSIGEGAQKASGALASGQILMLENLRFCLVRKRMTRMSSWLWQRLPISMWMTPFPARIVPMPRLKGLRLSYRRQRGG